MYESKYYTCEEIDQRLLQNYYDDLVASGYTGTKKEYQKLILSIADKVNLEIGKGLSTNDFTNELKEKLENLKIPNDIEQLIKDVETLKSQPIPGVEVLTESEIEDIFKELI